MKLAALIAVLVHASSITAAAIAYPAVDSTADADAISASDLTSAVDSTSAIDSSSHRPGPHGHERPKVHARPPGPPGPPPAPAPPAPADPTRAAGLQWTLHKDGNSPDQLDAYAKIETAMSKAVARHARLGTAIQHINVFYAPGVPTAEASDNGDLRFGANRVYMNERTALHEISHTLGVGQSGGFNSMCASGNWKTALPLLKSFDGPDAKINCGGGHFWPYGLNYDTEWSEQNADRNVLMLNAMLKDGM